MKSLKNLRIAITLTTKAELTLATSNDLFTDAKL